MSDFVVVYWDASRGIGTARPPHARHGSREGLFFGSTDIITLGEESLRPGSLIRGHRVPDPKKPGQDMVVEIEVYIPGSEPDHDFVEAMSRAEGLKVYE
jgi:hypothetical protein